MCELLGMSSNVPTDITFSLKALAQRGAGDSPHRDGWGIAFYNGTDVQVFRDHEGIADSAIAGLLQNHPIKSETVIAHIRHANVGHVCLSNTHPFTRELWGQHWTFAHNGQLKEFAAAPGFYNPVGSTDSEAIFCDLLNQIREQKSARASHEAIVPFIADACARYRRQGPLNCLLSNSEWLFAFCSTKLASVTRRKKADANGKAKSDSAVATIIATEPLTQHEEWKALAAGQWKLWKNGDVIAEGCVP